MTSTEQSFLSSYININCKKIAGIKYICDHLSVINLDLHDFILEALAQKQYTVKHIFLKNIFLNRAWGNYRHHTSKMHVLADVNLVMILLIMLVDSNSFLRKAITNSSLLMTPSLSVSISSITRSENFVSTTRKLELIRYLYLTFCGVGRSTRCISGTRWKRFDIMVSNSSLDMLPFLSESKILNKTRS